MGCGGFSGVIQPVPVNQSQKTGAGRVLQGRQAASEAKLNMYTYKYTGGPVGVFCAPWSIAHVHGAFILLNIITTSMVEHVAGSCRSILHILDY